MLRRRQGECSSHGNYGAGRSAADIHRRLEIAAPREAASYSDTAPCPKQIGQRISLVSFMDLWITIRVRRTKSRIPRYGGVVGPNFRKCFSFRAGVAARAYDVDRY